MTDDNLQRLLRSAMTPIGDATLSPDVWDRLNARLDAPPRWSAFDLALAAGVVLGLALVPDALFLIALHL